jgi:hypothetical protein
MPAQVTFCKNRDCNRVQSLFFYHNGSSLSANFKKNGERMSTKNIMTSSNSNTEIEVILNIIENGSVISGKSMINVVLFREDLLWY